MRMSRSILNSYWRRHRTDRTVSTFAITTAIIRSGTPILGTTNSQIGSPRAATIQRTQHTAESRRGRRLQNQSARASSSCWVGYRWTSDFSSSSDGGKSSYFQAECSWRSRQNLPRHCRRFSQKGRRLGHSLFLGDVFIFTSPKAFLTSAAGWVLTRSGSSWHWIPVSRTWSYFCPDRRKFRPNLQSSRRWPAITRTAITAAETKKPVSRGLRVHWVEFANRFCHEEIRPNES